MVIIIKNQEEMKDLAYKIGAILKGNELIALKGPLGAGKTTFTKYLGEYLKIKEPIISPTFNIVKVYNSKIGPFYHIDAYRLENIGYDPVLDDYLYDDKAIRVVEWYNYLTDEIFDDAIRIEIKIVGDEREVSIEGINLCID